MLKSVRNPKNEQRIKTARFVLPNLITSGAMFCSFLALATTIKGDYLYASKCIALAIVLDGLDGRVARKLQVTSDFGKELDSLSDLIAFGLAPAIIVYKWAFMPFADDFGIAIAFIFLVCAAIRLARFNTQQESKVFTGLPSPGAAAAVISIVYFMPETVTQKWICVLLMFHLSILGVLMASNITYPSIKHLRISDLSLIKSRLNPAIILIFAGAVVALGWYNNKIALLLGCQVYAFSGLAIYIGRLFLKKDISSDVH